MMMMKMIITVTLWSPDSLQNVKKSTRTKSQCRQHSTTMKTLNNLEQSIYMCWCLPMYALSNLCNGCFVDFVSLGRSQVYH